MICENCHDEYTEQDSPSDYYCSKYCQEDYVNRLTDEAESTDIDLALKAMELRARVGISEDQVRREQREFDVAELRGYRL